MNNNDPRNLHLRGATGVVRTEVYDGRDHLVVPVVALMEGVIHAINAQTPELVTADALTKSSDRWKGHPVVLGHPTKDGKQISAHDAAVMEKHGFGTLRESKMNGTRLGMEALVDPSRLELLGQQELLADLRAGKPIEVSVGAFVTTNDKSGVYNGRPYAAEWMEIVPDHLAFLPKGIGACSMEMGCGAHRTAEMRAAEGKPVVHLVTAEGIEPLTKVADWRALCASVAALIAAAKYMECATCGGTGSVDGNPCEMCDGNGTLKAAAGARHSAEDRTMIQSMHDQSVALGAECDNKFKVAAADGLKTACSCGGDKKMTKEQRDAAIKALVENKHSGFTAGDEKMLEGASDERLESFRVAAASRDAELKAAEEKTAADAAKQAEADAKLKAAESKTLTEEEFMRVAPAPLRSLIERKQAEDTARKAALVTTLKAAQSEFTESELAAEPLDRLERMARALQVAKPEPDYSGRGVVRVPADPKDQYAPPDPYAADIKALQERNSVN